MSDFEAPTAKWAMREMTAAHKVARMPLMKKNGTIGMKAPTAVEIAAEAADFQ